MGQNPSDLQNAYDLYNVHQCTPYNGTKAISDMLNAGLWCSQAMNLVKGHCSGGSDMSVCHNPTYLKWLKLPYNMQYPVRHFISCRHDIIGNYIPGTSTINETR